MSHITFKFPLLNALYQIQTSHVDCFISKSIFRSRMLHPKFQFPLQNASSQIQFFPLECIVSKSNFHSRMHHVKVKFPLQNSLWRCPFYKTFNPSLMLTCTMFIYLSTSTRSRKLMQEYACMQFYKAERQRLNYIKNNQAQIKAAKYKEFKDALHQNDNMENIGERIILPGTHYCSPRWYQNCFQDGMALVRSFGKPHLFLTFTANAKWPEIQASLEKKNWPNSSRKSCLNFNFKILTKPCALNKS